MSSPAPLLRPPIPGSRNASGSRVPKLGLSIPPSPHHDPTALAQGVSQLDLRPKPPKLKLPLGIATANAGPGERGRLPSLQTGMGPRPGQDPSSDESGTSRDNSSGPFRNPESSTTPGSARSLNIGGLNLGAGKHSDPSSAHVSASPVERESTPPDLVMLARDRGRPLDVTDLDDAGWKAAASTGMIIRLDSLGEGAGGAVTRCRLKDGKTDFAIKTITTDPDPDVKKQILRELNFNKACVSNHICQYYGAFMDDSESAICISMEFCEGGSLDSIYKEIKRLNGRTGEKVMGKVAEGVLNGLTYLYDHRIIHRDIKPSNILLTRKGEVKLCDFGVSGEFGTRGDANTFIGTSYYMAPERISGHTYTINSDVWSLGMSLMEVAQHRFPIPENGSVAQPNFGPLELLNYIVKEPAPKLKDELDGPGPKVQWSENFKYFIECCLEKDPQKRATPWKMLKEHPWMIEMKAKRVNMASFVSKVWNWPDEKTN